MDLNKWGRLALENLRNSRPDLLESLRKSGELTAHLEDVQENASAMFESLSQDLLQRHPGPNAMDDPMGRVRHLNWVAKTAEEFVLADLLLPDLETQKAMEQGGYLGAFPVIRDGVKFRELLKYFTFR